jgi:hypothetical protein
MFGSGSRIRDEKMVGSGMRKWSDPGSGIKHPGSATPKSNAGIFSICSELESFNAF